MTKPHPAIVHSNPPFASMSPEGQAALNNVVEAAIKQMRDEPAGFDVWIGRQKLSEMDWRADGALADDNEDDDVTEAPAEVVSFLGFDPFESDQDDPDWVDPDSVDGDSATTAAAKFMPDDKIEVEGEDGVWYAAKVVSQRGNIVTVIYDGEAQPYVVEAIHVRPHERNAIFNKAKERYRELDDVVDAASRRLNEVAGPEKGPMNLTPEHIRLSPAYRKAKAEYDTAAKALKTYSAWYVKQFKKELTAERRDPNYHAKRQAEIRARKAAREQGGVPVMASVEEVANAKIRSLKRLPTKAKAAQRPVNVRQRDSFLNRTKPGMKFLHKTEEVGGRPAEMKVFAVKGGAIHYDEPNARKPGFYCDPNYFYSKVFKEWVK